MVGTQHNGHKRFFNFVSHAGEKGDGQFNNRYYSKQLYRSGYQPGCISHSVFPEKRLLTDEENQSYAEVLLLVHSKRIWELLLDDSVKQLGFCSRWLFSEAWAMFSKITWKWMSHKKPANSNQWLKLWKINNNLTSKPLLRTTVLYIADISKRAGGVS